MSALLSLILSFVVLQQPAAGEAPVPKSPAGRSVTAAGDLRIPVVGTATVEGSSKTAVMTFVYERGGKEIRTTRAPKMRIARVTSSVARMAVKLPTDIFAIKLGPDMQRIFEEPILLDSDQEVECSCRMREDCGQGGVFECGLEGELVE